MPMPSSYDIAKVIRDLLTIAKVAMPAHLQLIDPRVQAGQRMLEGLNASHHRPPSVSHLPAHVPFIGEADPADPVAQEVLAKLDAVGGVDREIDAGLAAFLADEASPETGRPPSLTSCGTG